jgi:hypothetical protein
MPAFLNGKPIRAYLNGKKLNVYLNGKKLWDNNHEIELTPRYLSWKWDETDTRIITITAGDPPFGASLTSGDSYFDFTTDFDNMRIMVSPKTQNNTASKKTGTLEITDDGGDSIDVSLEQDFTLQASPTSLTWKWNEGGINIGVRKSVTITAGHVPISWSIISGDSDFAIENYNDSTASIYPINYNNTASKKTGVLRITDNDGYTIDVSLEQDFTFIWVAVGENKISISYDLGNTWK